MGLTRYARSYDPFGWGLGLNSGGLLPVHTARVWDSANRAYFWRVLSGMTITKIGVRVGVQSGNISLAVYRNSGSGRSSAPGTQLVTTGAIACPASGEALVSLGSSVSLQPGDWFGMSCDNNTASFFGTGVGITLSTALYSGMGGYQSSAHPCPATPAFTGIGMPLAATLVPVP